MPIRYDLVITLGSQIKHDGGHPRIYSLAEHTAMKAEAAAHALTAGLTERMVVSGGFNFGVRYDAQSIMDEADYSFRAFARARRLGISEAKAMSDVMIEDFNADFNMMILEESSGTTFENTRFVAAMLQRTPAFAEVKKIGVIAMLYHMKRALSDFQSVGIDAVPLFPEQLLVLKDPAKIEDICTYYSVPRAKKQWDVDRIRELLERGDDLADLLKE